MGKGISKTRGLNMKRNTVFTASAGVSVLVDSHPLGIMTLMISRLTGMQILQFDYYCYVNVIVNYYYRMNNIQFKHAAIIPVSDN